MKHLLIILSILFLSSCESTDNSSSSSSSDSSTEDVSTSSSASDNATDVIEHSAIFVSRAADESKYDRFNVTHVGWISKGWSYPNSTWETNLESCHSYGAKCQARVEFDAGRNYLTSFLETKEQNHADQASLDFYGNKIYYPWFPGFYWTSSYSPYYIDWLKDQMKTSLEASPDYIMIDAQTSSALNAKSYGGDFSSFSLDAYKTYLGKKYSNSELLEKGITDISTFNYKTFLVNKGYSPTSTNWGGYYWNLSTTPLIKDWFAFHQYSIGNLVSELVEYAKTLSDKNISFSTSSPVKDPYRSTFVSGIEFFTEELEQGVDFSGYNPFKPILSYKISELAGYGIVCNALPSPDWITIIQNNRPKQVRMWISQAYAYGANFMVPINEWAYDSSGNPHWFKTDNETHYDDLYDFIGKNNDLFNDYDPNTKTALIYSPEAGLAFSIAIYNAMKDLIENNIPFDVISAGDGWGKNDLVINKLNQYDVIIVNSDIQYFTSQQLEIINQLGSKKKDISDLNGIKEMLTSKVSTTPTNSNISIVPRKNKKNNKASYIFHLLNRNYDNSTDSIASKSNLRINIDSGFIKGSINKIYIHRPNKLTLDITPNVIGQKLELNIDELKTWGIIEVKIQ